MSSSSQSFSYSSSSYSSSASTSDGQTSGQRSVQQTHTGPDGTTTVKSASQNLGEPIVQQTQTYDSSGRQVESGAGGASRRIEDVTDSEQAQRDREYEERIEEEYAKREGGA